MRSTFFAATAPRQKALARSWKGESPREPSARANSGSLSISESRKTLQVVAKCGQGLIECSVVKSKQAIVFVAHHDITLACAGLEPGTIDNRDASVERAHQPLLLQRAQRGRHAGPAGT